MLKYLNNNLDKIAHFSISNFICWVISIIMILILKLTTDLPLIHIINTSGMCAILVSFLAGLYKEKNDPIFDKKDEMSNILGILTYTIQMLIIISIFKNNS